MHEPRSVDAEFARQSILQLRFAIRAVLRQATVCVPQPAGQGGVAAWAVRASIAPSPVRLHSSFLVEFMGSPSERAGKQLAYRLPRRSAHDSPPSAVAPGHGTVRAPTQKCGHPHCRNATANQQGTSIIKTRVLNPLHLWIDLLFRLWDGCA